MGAGVLDFARGQVHEDGAIDQNQPNPGGGDIAQVAPGGAGQPEIGQEQTQAQGDHQPFVN